MHPRAVMSGSALLKNIRWLPALSTDHRVLSRIWYTDRKDVLCGLLEPTTLVDCPGRFPVSCEIRMSGELNSLQQAMRISMPTTFNPGLGLSRLCGVVSLPLSSIVGGCNLKFPRPGDWSRKATDTTASGLSHRLATCRQR